MLDSSGPQPHRRPQRPCHVFHPPLNIPQNGKKGEKGGSALYRSSFCKQPALVSLGHALCCLLIRWCSLHGLWLQAGLADSLQNRLFIPPRLLFRCLLPLVAATAVSPALFFCSSDNMHYVIGRKLRARFSSVHASFTLT
jgi:hypothetical protein